MPGTNEMTFPELCSSSPRPYEKRRWRDPSPPSRPSSRASGRDPEVRRASTPRSRSPTPTILDLGEPMLQQPFPADGALEDDDDWLEVERTHKTRSNSPPPRRYSLGGFAPDKQWGAPSATRNGRGKCWEVVEVSKEGGESGTIRRRVCDGCPSCLRPAPYPRSSSSSVRTLVQSQAARRSSYGSRGSQPSSPLASPRLDPPSRPTSVCGRFVAAFRERSKSFSSAV